MSFKNNVFRAGTLCCAFWGLPACSASPEQPESGWVEAGAAENVAPSFEEYRETARTSVGDRDVFIVESDMLFDSEEALKRYYDELHVGLQGKSIINKVNGVADSRPNPTNIRYCFVAGWGVDNGTYTAPALASVRTNIQAAMVNWEGIANIRFVYKSNLDGASCNTDGANPGVDFVVTHWNNASTAIGPFPSNTWANQQLKVPTSGISRLLALHELGHALGYRHEHIHSGASPRCDEGGQRIELTSFDTASVMKYSNCTQSLVINGTELSALDATGAHMVYGPPSNNSLYIAQSGLLWRTDNDDGVFKQAGTGDWTGASSATTLGSFIYVIQDEHLWKVNPVTDAITMLGGANWGGPTAMAAINGTLYITQADGLWKITNLSTGAFTRMGTGDWTDATSMAAHGGSLYVIQDSSLWQVSPADGTFSALGAAVWGGVSTMASVGGSLYITQDDGLWKITNLSTGAFVRMGTGDWTNATSMTALDGRLYVVQDEHLWKVNPADGSFSALGGASWAGPTVMTAMP
jgi:hypothetical protein